MQTTRLVKAGFAAFALLAVISSGAQAPSDVPQDHWAYPAVEDLAARGLIKGYPPDGRFFGGRTVTRYEMATVVQRALARVDELLAQKAGKGEGAAAPSGVTSQQMDEIRKLVDEFKVELTVIGTDLAKVKDQVASLSADVGALKEEVGRQQTALGDVRQGVQSTIDAVKEQSERVDKLSSSKVDAGFGKIKVSGLLQAWVLGADSADPARGVTDTGRIRRSEIRFTGAVNPQTYWTVMIDPAKTLSLNTASSGGNLTGVSVNNAGLILQDYVLGYNLAPHVALEIGQQKVPLSMEALRSSAQLFTVERSLMNTLPTNSGRIGDIRDLGAMVRFTHPVAEAQIGIFNDGGNRQNNTDDNNKKEIIWHAQYRGLRYLTLGAYQAISGGVNGVLETLRNRQGLEAALSFGPHTLMAEWAQSRDAAVSGGVVTNPRVRSHGGYVLYAYRLNPRWELVGRGDYWNPNRDLHGADYTREYDLTLGANWYLTGHNAKIQFNWVRKNIVGPMNAAGTGPTALSALGYDRSLFMANFQQAF